MLCENCRNYINNECKHQKKPKQRYSELYDAVIWKCENHQELNFKILYFTEKNPLNKQFEEYEVEAYEFKTSHGISVNYLIKQSGWIRTIANGTTLKDSALHQALIDYLKRKKKETKQKKTQDRWDSLTPAERNAIKKQ